MAARFPVREKEVREAVGRIPGVFKLRGRPNRELPQIGNFFGCCDDLLYAVPVFSEDQVRSPELRKIGRFR
jgi:hypothetical protein